MILVLVNITMPQTDLHHWCCPSSEDGAWGVWEVCAELPLGVHLLSAGQHKLTLITHARTHAQYPIHFFLGGGINKIFAYAYKCTEVYLPLLLLLWIYIELLSLFSALSFLSILGLLYLLNCLERLTLLTSHFYSHSLANHSN